MRFSSLLRALTLCSSIVAVSASTAACKKAPDAEAVVEGPEQSGAITEENDDGTVSWSVGADGGARGVVKTKDGTQVRKNVTGTLTFKLSSGDVQAPAASDEATGLVIAQGPPLQDELTQIEYSLTIDAKAWTGTMHVPKGGTGPLAEDSQAAAPPPEGKVGPNGGVIQTVGDDRIEVVADKVTGQVRVYVLDADDKVIDVGERKVRLGVVGESSEVVGLERDPSGLYFVGRLSAKADPVRLTVAVTLGERTRACIVGWRPGVRLIVGARAPRVRLLAETRWGVDVRMRTDVQGRVVVRDDDDYRRRGGGVRVHGDAHDTHVKVKVKGDFDGRGHGNGHGNGHGHDHDHGGKGGHGKGGHGKGKGR